MSLGILKRVAQWHTNNRIRRLEGHLQALLETDASDPHLPLAVANLWRDTGAGVFTGLPMDIQICTELERRHTNLQHVIDLLEKTLLLIGDDSYEHLTSYLSRQLNKPIRNTVAEYLTDKKGYPLDIVPTYNRVTTLLYSLASVLDTLETYEYHRTMNQLFKDLILVLRMATAAARK